MLECDFLHEKACEVIVSEIPQTTLSAAGMKCVSDEQEDWPEKWKLLPLLTEQSTGCEYTCQ